MLANADITRLRRRRWQRVNSFGPYAPHLVNGNGLMNAPLGKYGGCAGGCGCGGTCGGNGLGGQRLAQLPEATGGVMASEMLDRTPAQSILIGVATGSLVWLVTRLLDRWLRISRVAV